MWEGAYERTQGDSERLGDLKRKVDLSGLENELSLGHFGFKKPFRDTQQAVGACERPESRYNLEGT